MLSNTNLISRFKVFTLNCWGVNIPPFDSSEHRLDRMESIANYIVEKKYDLVFLQVVKIYLICVYLLCIAVILQYGINSYYFLDLLLNIAGSL